MWGYVFKEVARGIGWTFVFNGLLAVFLTAILAFARGDDPTATFEVFAWVYGIAWASVWIGFWLLKRMGEWPPPQE